VDDGLDDGLDDGWRVQDGDVGEEAAKGRAWEAEKLDGVGGLALDGRTGWLCRLRWCVDGPTGPTMLDAMLDELKRNVVKLLAGEVVVSRKLARSLLAPLGRKDCSCCGAMAHCCTCLGERTN